MTLKSTMYAGDSEWNPAFHIRVNPAFQGAAVDKAGTYIVTFSIGLGILLC